MSTLREAKPGAILLPAFGVLSILAIYLVVADSSPAWLVLVLLGIAFISAMFWWRDPKQLLFLCWILTLPIDISKALIVEGGVYAPGLSLFLSDLFFMGYVAYRLFEKYFVNKRSFYFGPQFLIPLLFTIYMWISACFSSSTLAGVLAAVSHTKYFLTALIIADYVDNARKLRLMLAVLAVGMGLQVLMIMAQFVTGSDLAIQGSKNTTLGTTLVFDAMGSAFRPTGFLNHPNVVADYLVFLLPILFGFVLIGKKTIGRPWYVAFILLLTGAIALILTLSRAGWISFGIGLLFFLVFGIRKGITAKGHLVVFCGLLTALAIAVAIIYPAAYLRIVSTDHRSSESRWLMMDQAVLIISRNPVLGVGLGGYNAAAQENIPESYSTVSKYFQEDLLKGVVHNKYLLVAAEHGITGLILFLAVFVNVISRFFRFQHWTGITYLALGIGIVSGIVSQLVFYLFDNFYTDLRIQLFWLFFGLLLAVFRIEESTYRSLSKTTEPAPGSGHERSPHIA